MNSRNDQFRDGLIAAQLVKHCTGITKVWVRIRFDMPEFFRLSFHCSSSNDNYMYKRDDQY